jgi:hypothetical protein
METIYIHTFIDMLNGDVLASDEHIDDLRFRKNDIASSVIKILGRNGWELCGCYWHNDLLVRFWFKKSKILKGE